MLCVGAGKGEGGSKKLECTLWDGPNSVNAQFMTL